MIFRRREETEVTRTIKRVMPAIVSISVSRPASDVERELRAERRRDKKSPVRIPRERIDERGFVAVGGGSGFIADRSGIILTNKHVIDDRDADCSITTSDGVVYRAAILARDPVEDIAILKVEPERNLPTIALAPDYPLELGQTVLAFGNPLGIFQNTVSKGIISGLSRSVAAQADPESPPQQMRGLIQTDASINPGNSGGPLVNLYGDVIGINAAVLATAENISFAIPIRGAERDFRDILACGRIRRPLVGFRYITLDERNHEHLHTSIAYGALVTKEHSFDLAIIPGSPAEKAGIKEDDIVTAWNGTPITKDRSIPEYLETSDVGEVVKLTVLRGKREHIVSLTLAERR